MHRGLALRCKQFAVAGAGDQLDAKRWITRYEVSCLSEVGDVAFHRSVQLAGKSA
jgi:hypothetical protein